MATDLLTIARTFVDALLTNAQARNDFRAAVHPVDTVRAAAVITQYAAPVEPSDVPTIVPMIGELLAASTSPEAGEVIATVMPDDGGGPPGSIFGGDHGGGASGSIFGGDKDTDR